MSQASSSGRRIPNVPEEQLLLSELAPPRNGITITPTRAPTANKRGGAEFEKQPFLSAEPVRLTPAWEETNLPNDELNFKGVTMEQAHLEMNPPSDRFNIVYLILILHGVGTLMPWNMFITAQPYFLDYKMSRNYTGIDSNHATYFLSYVGFASQIPNLVFNWLNIFIQIGGNLTSRIVWSIIVEVLAFVFTVILAMIDTSAWPDGFFWATMLTIVVLNMANGVYQNTVYGMAAKLPAKYTGAVVLGSNISGSFTAIINMLSLWIAPNARTAAIYYFITALFVLLTCFDTYFALPLNRFYRYHELLSQKEAQDKKKENAGVPVSTPYWKIFKQCFPQCLNVFMVFFVTLSIFPAVHAAIQRSSKDFFITDDQYYTGVTCFLTFNFCAMVGSSLSALFTWPRPKLLFVPVVLRLLFIPLFIMFNYNPRSATRVFPVFINNDWVYWGVAVAHGLTSGYFSSVAMMYCPRTVEPQHAPTAGMFAAASLITGICFGLMFSVVLTWFVSNISL
ncbi:equilibrative nucleoside transporter 2 [Lycorma delicatula]|uniref:equilibrative nucleoside transporter 2 n=1 Tax=Lycorma delicatula TaxID=130591 RepID=UPI003F519FD5